MYLLYGNDKHATTCSNGRGIRKKILACCRSFSVTLHCFFFFQAEDGIRDLTVTGVQTCALPICQTPETRKRLLASLCLNGVAPLGVKHGIPEQRLPPRTDC